MVGDEEEEEVTVIYEHPMISILLIMTIGDAVSSIVREWRKK
jgi:hypothetical protein